MAIIIIIHFLAPCGPVKQLCSAYHCRHGISATSPLIIELHDNGRLELQSSRGPEPTWWWSVIGSPVLHLALPSKLNKFPENVGMCSFVCSGLYWILLDSIPLLVKSWLLGTLALHLSLSILSSSTVFETFILNHHICGDNCSIQSLTVIDFVKIVYKCYFSSRSSF